MPACDRCGEGNDAAARFCSACGAPLAGARHDGFEARKTVTILFCDVAGSTSLGEMTDPETTRRVMGRYAEAMTEVIQAHGGTVERFRGDEVMAVFGIPAAHEDDALRAVRAAAAMQRRLAQLNDELRVTTGVELACRIGINTGEVVAGDPGSGETFVTGDAVNLAKRLEQAAAPGAILIGTATYPLVKDAVEVGPRQRFTAKGKREPVTRFEVEHVDEDAAGFARRLDAPLVGRRSELDGIRAAIERHFDERTCGLLTITGQAGIGKSRLARELASQLASRARVAFGRCLPYGAGITYWPLVEIVRELGGTAAIARALERLDDDAVRGVQAAIGESEQLVPTDEVCWAVRRMLEELASERPLVICVEDLQWAEPTMLDLLEYVAAFAVGPLVILANARPELLETRPGWHAYPVFELSRLSEADSDALVASLGIEDVALRDRIASTAEGNPLFVEQLAAMLVHSETAPRAELELPPSIQALLAARLDSLEPEERRVLERAAVVGKEFWQRAVADLSSEADRPGVAGRLLALVRKGLVQPVRGSSPLQDTFRFRHALIRDVAYAGMPKRLRAELHESFASWLRSQPATGFGEHDEIVGYHAEAAYRYRAELGPPDERTAALAIEAAALLEAAGRRAFARDDMPAAATLLARTAELLPIGDPSRLDALRDAAIASWEAGDAAAGTAGLARLREEASAAGDERMVALADLEDVVHQQLTGTDVEAVQRAAERVIALAAAVSDDASMGRAWRRISAAHRRAGRYSTGESAAREALAHARRAGDLREEARAVDALCNCLLYGATTARDGLAECARLLAERGTTRTLEASVRGVAAAFNAMLGDIETARAEYGQAVSILDELGHELARAALSQIGAPLELLAGDPLTAEREARKGAEILERFGTASVQAPLIGAALLAQGQPDEALRAVHGVEIDSGPAIPQWQVNLRILRCRLAIASGQVQEAVRQAEAAVTDADETEDLNLRADALAARAVARASQGRDADAAADLAAARALYELKGNVAAVARMEPGDHGLGAALGASHSSSRGVGSAG